MTRYKVDAVQAFQIAHRWAVENNVPWEPGFSIFWIEKVWCISTNQMTLGGNLSVTVCPTTGRVLQHHWNAE